MPDDPEELEKRFGRRQLIVVITEDGQLELEGDEIAGWEMVGIGAFVMQTGEDELMDGLKEEEG